MKDGQRTTIEYVNVPSDLPVKKKVWQDLRVDFQGNHFTVSFEGRTIVDVRDDHISGSGSVGVWTKEDSTTFFDNFSFSGK